MRSKDTLTKKSFQPTSKITELENDLNDIIVMANAIMVGGAVIIGSNYLVWVLGGDDTAAQEEKVHHDKGLEAYQETYAKCTYDCTRLFHWIVQISANKGEGQAELH